jgi:hypothetical protein
MDSCDDCLPGVTAKKFKPKQNKFAQKNCPITFDTFKKGEMILEFPCGHISKKKDGEDWLANHQTCPLCGANIGGTGYNGPFIQSNSQQGPQYPPLPFPEYFPSNDPNKQLDHQIITQAIPHQAHQAHQIDTDEYPMNTH